MNFTHSNSEISFSEAYDDNTIVVRTWNSSGHRVQLSLKLDSITELRKWLQRQEKTLNSRKQTNQSK